MSERVTLFSATSFNCHQSFRCPAAAIPPKNRNQKEGVITEKCYGCGRCITVCPLGLIDSLSYQSESSLVCDLIRREEVDAIEIHTGPNHENAFRTLWSQIGYPPTTLFIVFRSQLIFQLLFFLVIDVNIQEKKLCKV